ncbi:MAG: RHS repeat protein, partial [Lentisphaerae bacterium]|nr:RHS repeat protein [Lentisphaerota bacterium]
RHSRSGGSIYDFSLQQQIYYADFIESETVEETFTGRVISTARPGYGGAMIKTVNHYDGGGRVTAVETWSENPTDNTLLSRTLHTYDELGQLLLTCQDLDLDGTIDPAGADRVSGSDTRYLLINGDWWRQHTSWTYPEPDFLLPLTNAITRTRLTGLGVSSADGLLTAVTVSIDALGNATTECVYTDPTTCRVTRHTTRPGVATPAVTISIAGRIVSATAPDGATVTYAYDGFGRMVAESGPRDALRLTSYNSVGDIAWSGIVVGSVTNITTHQFDYESSGLYTRETDPLGNDTSREYAHNSTLNYVQGSAVKFAVYTHDPFGRMTTMSTVRDEEEWDKLDTTRWVYDAPTGLLTAKTYADGHGTTYSYTPDGKLASRTWARDLTTDYTYDTANNLIAISYNDSTPNVTFNHDRFDRVTAAVTAAVSSNLYAYSHTGLLTNEISCGQSSVAALSRPHDTLGRPAGLILDPLAETQGEGAAPYAVTYNYDDHGRLNSLHASVQSRDITFTYNYLPNSSLITSVASSVGASFTRTYEPHRDLITAVTNHWNGTPVSSFAYVNDAIGRRTQRLDDGTVTNVFGYNGCSELTSAVMGTNAYSYAYDGIGNRLNATDNDIALVYHTNPLNQYTNILRDFVASCEPEYDLDGNMTATGEGWHYVWNGENRMIHASNNAARVEYAYDHRGRMVNKTISTAGTATEKTISYVWDDYNIITETIAQDGVTSVTYNVWGLDLSGTMQGAGGIGGLLAVIRDGEPFFPCYDANGNITEYLDTNGVIVAHYEYSPFGEIVNQSGVYASTFTHRFSTK